MKQARRLLHAGRVRGLLHHFCTQRHGQPREGSYLCGGGAKGAGHVAQWFEALRDIPERDTARMEEVTKKSLGKPNVRRGSIKT